MSGEYHRLSEMDFDEISFVDDPAHQDARVVLFKAADGGVEKHGSRHDETDHGNWARGKKSPSSDKAPPVDLFITDGPIARKRKAEEQWAERSRAKETKSKEERAAGEKGFEKNPGLKPVKSAAEAYGAMKAMGAGDRWNEVRREFSWADGGVAVGVSRTGRPTARFMYKGGNTPERIVQAIEARHQRGQQDPSLQGTRHSKAPRNYTPSLRSTLIRPDGFVEAWFDFGGPIRKSDGPTSTAVHVDTPLGSEKDQKKDRKDKDRKLKELLVQRMLGEAHKKKMSKGSTSWGASRVSPTDGYEGGESLEH